MSLQTHSIITINQQNESSLHDKFSKEDIEDLHSYFRECKNSVDRDALRKLLGYYNLFFTEDQFENLFLKIDINRDGNLNWHEFVSYLTLGLRDNDPANQKTVLQLPIIGEPEIYNGVHRHKIIRIEYTEGGGYTTIGSDGLMKYWNLNWGHIRTEETSPKIFRCRRTLVLDAISLPSFQMLCVSSVKCDVRFFDTVAKKCIQRFSIAYFPFAINVMHFHSSTIENSKNKLILGDFEGNVWVLEIPEHFRNYFNTDNSVAEVKFSEIVKNVENRLKIKCLQFRNIHADMIRQVGFIGSLNSFISAADYQISKNVDQTAAAVIIGKLGAHTQITSFMMRGGTTCFAFDERTKTLVTGGPDCNLRLWNLLIPSSTKSIFQGHSCAIKNIFLQDNFSKTYSIDRMKIVIVWDTEDENIIQTFHGFKLTMTEDLPAFVFYNDLRRELVLGTKKVVILSCCPLLNLDLTDGYTHTRPVSVVLYNELFRSIVTCGYDSYIIIWDPWTGKRSTFIKMAHSRVQSGQILRVEITAACFDAKGQLLLTGARDGTLNIWNFIDGVCIRHLSITSMCEVTEVFWVSGRILAVGWDKVVTEFIDDGKKVLDFITWKLCHTGEILCAAKNRSEAITTCSCTGELVLWNSWSGQPYLRFNIKYPKTKLKILYKKSGIILDDEINKNSSSDSDELSISEISKISSHFSSRYTGSKSTRLSFSKERTTIQRARKLSTIELPDKLKEMEQVSVQSVLFLDTRPMAKDVGSFLIALSDGTIQMWSHHPKMTSLMTSFNAIHMAGDQVTAMATDKENFYLFTGSTHGYVKIWVIADYCLPSEHAAKVSKVEQRIKFPFLWKDTVEGRAKRSVLEQKKPWLVNSFNAHKNTIIKLVYIDGSQVLVSASADCSVRLWTIQGQYVGTLGSPVKWESITPNETIPPDFAHRLPPDLKREISFTTLKVLTGGKNQSVLTSKLSERRLLDKMLVKQVVNEIGEPSCDRPYARLLQKPLMRKHLPLQEKSFEKPVLDTSLPIIPIYSHLKIYPTVKISAPRRGVSECLQKLDELECIFAKN